ARPSLALVSGPCCDPVDARASSCRDAVSRRRSPLTISRRWPSTLEAIERRDGRELYLTLRARWQGIVLGVEIFFRRRRDTHLRCCVHRAVDRPGLRERTEHRPRHATCRRFEALSAVERSDHFARLRRAGGSPRRRSHRERLALRELSALPRRTE